jgi:hypothetical protein
VGSNVQTTPSYSSFTLLMAWFKTSLVTCYFSPPPQHGIGKQGTYQQMKMQGIQRPFHHSNKKTNSKEGHDWLKLGLN